MTDTIDCPNCGATLPARNKNGQRRTYCSIEGSAAYRPKLLAQRRALSRATHDANVAGEARFQAERRKRQARQRRREAA